MSDQTLISSEDLRNRKRYYFEETRFRRIVIAILRFLFSMILETKAVGAENIPTEGSVVLAANHLTNFDVFPLQLCLQRPLFFMAKSELHKNALLDAALRACGAFPVFRGQKDQWAIDHAEKVLEHGNVLAMFPEGTRSKGRGLRAAKTGAARLAIKANCPIIPVSISGTHQLFQDFPRRSKVTISIGEPIYPDSGVSTLGLTDKFMFSIADMLPSELRGVYAKKPAGFNE